MPELQIKYNGTFMGIGRTWVEMLAEDYPHIICWPEEREAKYIVLQLMLAGV